MKELEQTLLNVLPKRLSEGLKSTLDKVPEMKPYLEEIRLRRERVFSLVAQNYNIPIRDIWGQEIYTQGQELAETLRALCGDSVHSFDREMLAGTFFSPLGVRTSVVGEVNYEDGALSGFRSIDSVVIRMPLEIRNSADGILPYLYDVEGLPEYRMPLSKKEISSALIYAPPGQGKTTVLRDVIRKVTKNLRGGVIDRIGELYHPDAFRGCHVDFLTGYELAQGIAIATRALNEQVLFCDEIGSPGEAESILATQNTGVPLIATAHAGSLEELLGRPPILSLHESGVFSKYIGICRDYTCGSYRMSVTPREKALVW